MDSGFILTLSAAAKNNLDAGLNFVRCLSKQQRLLFKRGIFIRRW